MVEGYGLSEASPVTHVGPLNNGARFGTIGLPLPDTDCRLVDSETGTTDVAEGQVGELLVRGPQVMLGYWHDVKKRLADHSTDVSDGLKSACRMTNSGWLPTGDLARITPDGLYQIVDRKKDMIITSGFNVYPQEVEHVLKTHASVKDAAVVGVPDSMRGEVVKAFLVLNSGCEWDEESLKAHCHEHLSSHKRPRLFEVCEGDLPRSFLGKVIRRKLRE